MDVDFRRGRTRGRRSPSGRRRADHAENPHRYASGTDDPARNVARREIDLRHSLLPAISEAGSLELTALEGNSQLNVQILNFPSKRLLGASPPFALQFFAFTRRSHSSPKQIFLPIHVLCLKHG